MGYLYDSNKGIYVHESLVMEDGSYDIDLYQAIKESVMLEYSWRSDKSAYKVKKAYPGASRVNPNTGREGTPGGITSPSMAAKEDDRESAERHNKARKAAAAEYKEKMSSAKTAKDRIAAREALRETNKQIQKSRDKEKGLIAAARTPENVVAKRNNKGYQPKQESYNYSTEFFSNLELK